MVLTLGSLDNLEFVRILGATQHVVSTAVDWCCHQDTQRI